MSDFHPLNSYALETFVPIPLWILESPAQKRQTAPESSDGKRSRKQIESSKSRQGERGSVRTARPLTGSQHITSFPEGWEQHGTMLRTPSPYASLATTKSIPSQPPPFLQSTLKAPCKACGKRRLSAKDGFIVCRACFHYQPV